MELEDVYTGRKSWSDLREDANRGSSEPHGPHELVLRRGIGRLLHVDDLERITTYSRLLSATPPDQSTLSQRELRLLRMLVASIADQVVDKTTTLHQACHLVWQHPQILAELRELLPALQERVSHLPHVLDTHPEVPLQVHARYTRIEILAALGIGDVAKVAPWQTGVYHAERARTDLLAFTLDKTVGEFSPTTRYRDYAINAELVHWESQSVTRADSETGRRYQSHQSLGSHVLLFARLRSDDRAFWFLGPASYVKHEGEQPMAITWRLRWELPGDLFVRFAAAVA